MRKNPIETLMGAVVLAAAGGFLAFAYKGSEMRGPEHAYTVKAKFSNATGLNTGSDVRIGGVKIGVVSGMTLDAKTYEAVVAMQLQQDVPIPDDSTASISSSGLLGEKFVQLAPGASEENVKDGGTLQFTQSSVSLEEMIGKFMFSGGGVDKGGKPKPEADAPAPAAEGLTPSLTH